MFYITTYPSPVGLLTLASDGMNLCGLWLEGQKYFGGSILKSASSETLRKELPVFSRTSDWLDRYFSGKKPLPSELPLAPSGGEFRKLVWELLCEIPYGEVTTYGALAKKAAAKASRLQATTVTGKSQRAVSRRMPLKPMARPLSPFLNIVPHPPCNAKIIAKLQSHSL